MILAIILRYENISEEEPFNCRYYLTEYFKSIFDKYNILLFPIVSEKNIDKICNICDGLIVTGSAVDIHPRYYNENPIKGKKYNIDEFKLDKKVIELFANHNKPILGICGGLQSINVCFGGSLNQAIDNHDLGNTLHKVAIKKESFLDKIYHRNEIMVNSFHRQSIKNVAPGFEIVAISDDKTIEAIEKNNIIAVQWHPEQMVDFSFFEYFIKTVSNK